MPKCLSFFIVLFPIWYDLISFLYSIWARFCGGPWRLERRGSEGPCVDPRDILGAILPQLSYIHISHLSLVHIHYNNTNWKATFLSHVTKYSRVWACGLSRPEQWTGLAIHSPKSNHSPPQYQNIALRMHRIGWYKYITTSIINPLAWKFIIAYLAWLVPTARTSLIRWFGRVLICRV